MTPALEWHGVPLTRTSERSAAICPWKHRHTYGLGRGDVSGVSPALAFGSAWHEAMEARYKPGTRRGSERDMLVAFGKYLDAEGVSEDDRAGIRGWDPSYWEAAKTLIPAYVAHWGEDAGWEILQPECRFQVLFRHADGSPAFIYTGTFDAIYRNHTFSTGPRLGLLEHKTNGATANPPGLEWNDQGSSYFAIAGWWAGEYGLTDGEPLDHILWNVTRKSRPYDGPVNDEGLALTKTGKVSKNQPAPVFARTVVDRTPTHQASTLRRIYRHTLRIAEQRTLPLHDPGMYKVVDERKCMYMCSVRVPCEIDDETGGRAGLAEEHLAELLDQTTAPWEPFGSHLDDLAEAGDIDNLPTIVMKDI